LFQVAFGLQDAPVKTLTLPQLRLTPLTFSSEMARYDLTLWMIEGEDGLTASWTYNTDLFEASAILAMQTHFATLLQSIVASPETRLSALEIYSESEKREQAERDRGWEEINVQKLLSGRRKSGGRPAHDLADAHADQAS
jgi:non-ribosomal peptide synthetase component F